MADNLNENKIINDHKISFIICSNNELYLTEAMRYLSYLDVPDGYEADVQVISEAESMLLGMKEGREQSDAKYKVYMHQDVFIINPHFIQNVIDIFESDKNIGMIGMFGSEKMPKNAVMWDGPRIGNVWGINKVKNPNRDMIFSNDVPAVKDVVCVDGLMMITAYDDVPFRTDILSGWDFYDVSTSFEYKRAGYRVVVPVQPTAWCIHEDGMILELWNYDEQRQVVLKEYKEFL